MKYAVALEVVPESEQMPGYFYAHIPSLGLTTHGLGESGALEAAKDLVKLWLQEKKVRGGRGQEVKGFGVKGLRG